MNKTIHELNALITLANDDELIVYDVATGTSKKVKKSDLKNQLAGDLIVDAVTDGDMHAVTSNAVFDRFGKMQVVTGDANNLTSMGFYTGYGLTNAPVSGWVNYTVTCYDNSPLFVKQIALTDSGIYIRECGAGVWGSWLCITKPQVVSRTVCTPYGASTKFNQNDIDCLTDCKYSNGLHHVSGLITFNPSATEVNGFYLSATPSRVIEYGNAEWIVGVTNVGSSVICICPANYVLRWGDAEITKSMFVCFDFWYEEA